MYKILLGFFCFFFKISTVIFDKTGTLTRGTPTVTHIEMFVGHDVCPPNFFMALVSTVEANSDHPLAIAIVDHAKEVRF